ncbi:hypothetical protein PB2503_00040 [Parvularcula bermudensis HTCC2503]|uniref:DUF3526 domain-containing protein n=1 Tax=Parvularcula bermudensis (strain ATCC BAA-594 / HTCC2503 / KCTC 12087) TaxID=314260 RepID=E0THW8_PARBH|nr:DUF3526 domain-containing protein [Parvularcula bermudensis]ADM10779.1 hypothetical protein PB2503_00040 [Parvularcula bermudensis HTCC2503]
MLRDRSVIVWLLIVLFLSSFAVWSGLSEVAEQRATIDELIEMDREGRTAQLAKQEDWGGAAYYGFYLTYDPPSDFAFAAMGQRDAAPWKHRVRMLALEGQIYESDVGNPVLALVGRFDFAFLVAVVVPLILIVMLYDLQATERSVGRYELLTATAGSDGSLWRLRSLLRAAALILCLLIPLLIGGLVDGTSPGRLFLAVAVVIGSVGVWWAVCLWFAARQQPAPVILASLLGVWALLVIVFPAAGKILIEQSIQVPTGGEIIMTQREAVNDAWDLPKEATMTAFLERHPEWADFAAVERAFEWKWYFAFQQVGDQKAEALSEAYRNGRAARDRMAGRLALFSPPALVERRFQRIAGTDAGAMLDYEDRVRAFHADLRAFFYPKLFREEPFDYEALDDLPTYDAS